MVRLFYFGILFSLLLYNVGFSQVVVNAPTSVMVGEGTGCIAVNMGNITITETTTTDFSGGSNLSYVIDLPNGFEFSNADATTININYSVVTGTSTYSASSISNALSNISGRKRRLTFYYTITNTGNDVGRFTISGISLTCYNAGAYGNIVRTGTGGAQNGNAVADAQSHGFLDSRINLSCEVYSPTYTTLVPITAPHQMCSGNYLYFATQRYIGATYNLYEGSTLRTTTTVNGGTGTYYMNGIQPNSNGGMTNFHVEVTKSDNCTFSSEEIDFDFLSTPYATIDHSYQAPMKDTSFPKSAPVVDLGNYISVGPTDSISYFNGPGVYNIGGSSYIFDPGSIITGQHQLYYTLIKKDKSCSKTYPFGHKFTVYDPLEPPPNYIVASKSYPFCENGGNFTVRFKPPAGKVLTYIYLYRKSSGTVSGPVSLGVDGMTGTYTINPKTDDYNGRLYTYIYYKDNGGSNNYQYFDSDYITIFPERSPQLLGLPATVSDTMLLCTVGKDSVIMHANPIGGQYIIDKYKTNAYTTLTGTDLTKFAQKPIGAPDNTYKAFVPETLYKTLGESDDQIKFRITYIYPPLGLSFCPDTVIKYIRFVKPVDVDYTIVSPIALPYCHGDSLRLVVNNSSPGDKFYWNFGDGISKESDSLVTSYYQYAKPGRYLLRFKSIVDILPTGTCNNDILDTIKIGAKPIADFVVQNNYEKVVADFSSLAVLKMENKTIDNGVVDEINSWTWLFGDGNTSTSNTDSLTTNQYDHYKSKPYTVQHIAQSGWGCKDTIQREIPVFPMINFSTGDYTEDYDVTDSTGFYQSGDYKIGGNSSWKYQPPTGDTIIVSASPAWVTENGKVDTSYNFDEFSWVESPGFRIDQLQLPMLAVDTWCLTESQLDGACLQWAYADTTFGNEKWHTIGVKDQGVNWYNYNIVVGMLNKVEKNGLDTPGWTSSTGNQWQRSRFNLDKVKALVGIRPIRFRILFVSNSDNAPGRYDGFAFDNFFVGERNRKVLVEEFCDYLNYETEFNNSVYVKNSQLVRMQYHSRYMNLDDEINNQNKGEVSARNLLYGYSQLPRAAVDGTYSLDYSNGFFGAPTSVGLGERNFDKRSLDLSPYKIEFNTPTVVGNQLQFSVDVARESLLDNEGPFVIQVAVMERQVVGNGISFTNVFRKFLPDAGGKHVDKDGWPLNTTISLNRSFTPYVPLMPIGDEDTSLVLVAFVQDEATGEVYQAEEFYVKYKVVKDLSVAPLPARLGGADLDILLYPNPAQTYLDIFLRGTTSEEYFHYRIVDGYGKSVSDGCVKREGNKLKIDGLQNLPIGVYQIQLHNSDANIVKTFSLVR